MSSKKAQDNPNVQLAASARPVFGIRCVCCGQHTNGKVAIVTRDLSFLFTIRGGWHLLRAPACRRCGLGHYAWRIWYLVRTLGAALLIFWLCVITLPPLMPGWAAGLVYLLLLCLALVAIEVQDHFFAPVFQVNNLRRLGIIGIQFRNQAAAQEFRELNPEHLVQWPSEAEFDL